MSPTGPGEDGFEGARIHVLKRCPWCGGRLRYERAYPVLSLVPGDLPPIRDETIPEHLRVVAAWVCRTAHCRYREKA